MKTYKYAMFFRSEGLRGPEYGESIVILPYKLDCVQNIDAARSFLQKEIKVSNLVFSGFQLLSEIQNDKVPKHSSSDWYCMAHAEQKSVRDSTAKRKYCNVTGVFVDS